MQYARKQYMDQLIRKKDNGRIKVITGLRRSGKSYLLFTLYRQYLLDNGVGEDQIVGLALDEIDNAKYRNPFELNKVVKERMPDKDKRYYVFIDEIQFVTEIPNPYVDDPNEKLTFIDVVLGLMKLPNADIYVTGSNSKMLSSDILTQFRDRGDEIRVNPLSFAEVYEHYEGDKRGAWRDYYTYGGMPLVWTMESHEEKSRYLRDLFNRTYIKDVLERHQVNNDAEVLEILLNVLASGIGSLTNPSRLSNTFASERQIRIAPDTIDTYIGYFMEAFLIRRGFDVDVGVIEQNVRDESGKNVRKQLEIDFVVNRGDERCYIQSALSINDPEKKEQEIASLIRIPDSFKKIVVVKDYVKPWWDDNGIQYVGIEDFLLDESLISG